VGKSLPAADLPDLSPPMGQSKYSTAPVATDQMPGGIPYIVCNEAAERFSYYGMRAILVIFMTQYLMNSDGQVEPMSEADAKGYFHLFSSGVYFFPIIGALFSDILWGKYRTIIMLSVVYCLGHFALAMDETRLGLTVGLTLIAIGSGGIKPCVSAHVGDQFGKSNHHLLGRVFMYFYFAINLGAFLSSLATPLLLENYGPSLAFGVPGILMVLATLFFWMGRNKFVHIPPGGKKFFKEAFSKEGIGSIAKLFIIYAFVAMFWALYDQTASSWILQAKKMDRVLFGIEWLPSQLNAVNPLMILAFIPIFAKIVYPAIDKVFPLTPLRKIGMGFFITVIAFLIPGWIELRIAAGETPNIIWQVLATVVITIAEVMVSITCLEFSYTQASNKMKSFIMALFLLSVSMGNLFTSFVNFFIQNDDGTSKITGANYYFMFSGLMLLTAFVFIPVAKWYKVVNHIQDEA
jgi:proton-dependent oligopeptide transporter, POT family